MTGKGKGMSTAKALRNGENHRRRTKSEKVCKNGYSLKISWLRAFEVNQISLSLSLHIAKVHIQAHRQIIYTQISNL